MVAALDSKSSPERGGSSSLPPGTNQTAKAVFELCVEKANSLRKLELLMIKLHFLHCFELWDLHVKMFPCHNFITTQYSG